MLCWVLGSLVVPLVSLLVPGVSAGGGVVASDLRVDGGAGVGVVVPGPGFGRGWLGVAGCGRSPLLAEGLVGPPLCPRGVSGGPAASLVGGCRVLVLWVFLRCVRLWCGQCLRFGVWCAFVGLVSVAVVAVCVVGMRGRVCGVLVVRLGACPRLSTAWIGGSVWVWGLCVVAPVPSRLCGSPPPLAGVCSWCVPPPPPLRALPPLPLFRVAWGGVPLVPCPGLPGSGGWGGVLVVGSGPFPWCFSLGGADACTPRQGVTLLYGPSICTRSVQMDLLRSQVLQPFPTPGSGALWVAGESLRDRRLSCLPRWTVCPTRSPSLGPNRSTCRGECSWSGPLVTPPGRCHRGPLTNGPGRIPPYCVCSGGADTVTGGGPKPLRLGPSPASPVGPFRPAPLFAVWFAVVGFPSGGSLFKTREDLKCSI